MEQRGGDDPNPPKSLPTRRSLGSRLDHRALFVAGVDHFEEQVAAARNDWEVAYFVDDEQRSATKYRILRVGALWLGFGERGDDIGEGLK